MEWSRLDELPDGVAAARTVAARLDDALVSGLARLSSDERAGLEGLAATFFGTPLEARVGAAVASLARGAPSEDDAHALAIARASLLGAVHDALLAHACAALGRMVPPTLSVAPPAPLDPLDEAPLRNARHWLLELAIAGLGQLGVDSVAPFSSALDALCERAALVRPAALLSGFHDELMDSLPLASRDAIPRARWADLWTRAVMATFGTFECEHTPIEGRFDPIGADVRHHDHVISVCVYGVFDRERIVRATFSGWKVDALAGAEALRVLAEPAGIVLGALANDRSVRVSGSLAGLELTVSEAEESEACDPFRVDPRLAFPVASPPDRHPIQLAVPVHIDSVTLTRSNGTLHARIEDSSIRIAEERISPLMRSAKGELDAADELVALLRFDADGWALQPIAARIGKQRWGLAAAVAESKKSSDALSILEERASKLLRS